MKKIRKNPESDVCKNLWTWFQWQYPAVANRYLRFEVRQTSKIQQAILKAEGNKSGTSDILIAIPTTQYAGLFLEVKADKGRLSDKQKEFQAALSPDYECQTGYGFDQCAEIISRYMESAGLKRAHLQL